MLLLISPISAYANNKPSMTYMWVEIGLIAVVLLVLKAAHFSNSEKMILFISYIVAGILTQTIWFPVILFIGIYIYFSKRINGHE